MKTALTIVIAYLIWIAFVEIEKLFGLIPFGTIVITTIFFFSLLLIPIFRSIYTNKNKFLQFFKQLSKVTGVLLILILATNITFASLSKSNFRIVLNDLRIYHDEHQIFPTKLADIKTKSNYYGFIKHDFIYEFNQGDDQIIVGYHTPLGDWRYCIKDLDDTDYIFNAE